MEADALNPIRLRERARAARHEAAHVAAEIYLGFIPGDVVIDEPDGTGYITGSCSGVSDPGAAAVMFAVGVLDGHGALEDEANLVAHAPDPDHREEVLQLAAKVMAAPEFAKVHEALRLRLQFTDRLERDQITEIAAKALGVPVPVLLASCRGSPEHC